MSIENEEEKVALKQESIDCLLEECPCGGNPKVCQLYDLRKRTAEEKELWVNILSPTDKELILKRHLECLKTRRKS